MEKTIWIPDTWDDCQYNSECECDLRDAVCSDETADKDGGLPFFCPLRIIRDNADKYDNMLLKTTVKIFDTSTDTMTVDKYR